MVLLVALGLLVVILISPGSRQEAMQTANRSTSTNYASTKPEERAPNVLTQDEQRLAAMTPEQRDAESKKAAETAVADGVAILKGWRERETWAAAHLAGKKVKEPASRPVTKQEWLMSKRA